MAIAGITIQTTAEAYGTVRERLCASKDVADTQETGVPGMLAAVMETDAAYIGGCSWRTQWLGRRAECRPRIHQL